MSSTKPRSGSLNFRCLYRCYIKSAKQRGLEWALSEERFAELTKQDCYLCGAKPGNKYVHSYNKPTFLTEPYIYNGIDRFDNSRGYVAGNVISACGVCNMAKKEMDIEAFLEYVKRVYTFNFGVEGDGR